MVSGLVSFKTFTRPTHAAPRRHLHRDYLLTQHHPRQNSSSVGISITDSITNASKHVRPPLVRSESSVSNPASRHTTPCDLAATEAKLEILESVGSGLWRHSATTGTLKLLYLYGHERQENATYLGTSRYRHQIDVFLDWAGVRSPPRLLVLCTYTPPGPPLDGDTPRHGNENSSKGGTLSCGCHSDIHLPKGS